MVRNLLLLLFLILIAISASAAHPMTVEEHETDDLLVVDQDRSKPFQWEVEEAMKGFQRNLGPAEELHKAIMSIFNKNKREPGWMWRSMTKRDRQRIRRRQLRRRNERLAKSIQQ